MTLLGACLACAGRGAEAADGSTSPRASDLNLRKPPAAREVSFVTEDNLVICAGYTPPPQEGQKAPVVMLLPMYRHDRLTYDPLIPHLHDAGFAVLAIDMRGHGRSTGPPELKLAERVAERDARLFKQMDRDVAAAYGWLVEQPDTDPARLAIVGASIGCSVALRYAAVDRSVDAVVCLTPGVRYLGIDSISDAGKYGERSLLLLASVSERSAAEELGKLAPRAVVQIVPGAEADPMALHGTRMFGKVPGIERKIAEFLVQAVGPPAVEPVVGSLTSDVYHAADSGTAKRISPKNRRWFSSPAEAEARGLHAPRGRAVGTAASLQAQEPFPDPQMDRPQP